jgi:uncharacterized protein involved in outer membrane biogenesis
MKKVLIAIAVLVVVIVGAGVFLFSNLDNIVEAGIETAGTSTLGTAVEVESVELDLVGGTASIYGFSIANPTGFSNASMVSFEELSVSINLQNTSGDQIHINSVVARSPFVLYESVDGETNVDAVSARFDSEEEVAEESDDSAAINLIIDSIVIEDIQATLISGFLPEPVDVGLGDIRLNDLEGSPDDIASEIMSPLLAQVASAAAQALVQATADILSNAAEGAADALEGVADQASEALESVGNLFKRD